MHTPRSLRSLLVVTPFALAAPLAAQVPDGYIAFGTFGTGPGTQGIYFTHPRDTTATPIAVTNLPANLAAAGAGSHGVASMLRRASDGALIVGERAPAGASVDLHVLHLSGSQVTFAQLFSCGTSQGVGEIPQAGLLPDGRVVVAATDLEPGALMAHFDNNAGYGWQGLSIVDTDSGAFTTVAVSNWNQFVGVMNGLAVSRDGSTIYLGSYISSSSGELWEIPTAGGAMTMVASLPFGDSNITIDQDDTVLLTTLNGPPNLFRYEPATTTLSVIPTTNGALNAIAIEPSTGNYLIATANSGNPGRALWWRTPTGADNLLIAPGLGTISSIAVNPNPETYGAGTPGQSSYRWLVAPNPGGLPEAGNGSFSLTIEADPGTVSGGIFAVGYAATPPTNVLGLDVLVDPSNAAFLDSVLVDSATLDLPIPAQPNLVGAELFVQSFWIESTLQLAASDGLSMTVL